ncbi:MAG: ornithine carbamoyltransferase [Candidatus Omnitrophica bacterium]|nr:ornithine carbamoyltransferase [Candidatus Omnitrophota bacterium]
MKRDFLNITDLNKKEILFLFEKAGYYKEMRKNRKPLDKPLTDKNLGLLFEKPSSRTRISFEVGIRQLGGFPIFLSPENLQITRGERTIDTAKIFNLYLDGLIIRTFKQKEAETFAMYTKFPVINALTDEFHPCQAMTDFFTLWEINKSFKDIVLLYIGDANNVCNTLILGADILGIKMNICTPGKYKVKKEIRDMVKDKTLFKETTDPQKFIKESNVIYTDSWISMGDEKEKEKIKKVFLPYQINKKLLKNAPAEFLFMHCLPAHRNWEVTDEILDGPHSIILKQAENRLYVQQSLLSFLYT